MTPACDDCGAAMTLLDKGRGKTLWVCAQCNDERLRKFGEQFVLCDAGKPPTPPVAGADPGARLGPSYVPCIKCGNRVGRASVSIEGLCIRCRPVAGAGGERCSRCKGSGEVLASYGCNERESCPQCFGGKSKPASGERYRVGHYNTVLDGERVMARGESAADAASIAAALNSSAAWSACVEALTGLLDSFGKIPCGGDNCGRCTAARCLAVVKRYAARADEARCPTCSSPDPKRHPAVQFEGEVQECRDPWHTNRSRTEETLMTPTEMILRYFEYKHLPPALQEVSKPFCDLAQNVADSGIAGPETTTGLRKLLEAKDCIVRAHLHERTVTG